MPLNLPTCGVCGSPFSNGTNSGREVTSRVLYEELTSLLWGDKKPPSDWPKSTKSFGKRLAGIRRELRTIFDVEWHSPGQRKLLYAFKTKD